MLIVLLAQAAEAAPAVAESIPAAADGMPAWLVGLLAVLSFLLTSGLGAALVQLVRAKARALEAEALAHTLIDGVKRANGGGEEVKAKVAEAAAERGTTRLVDDAVAKVTGKRPGE